MTARDGAAERALRAVALRARLQAVELRAAGGLQLDRPAAGLQAVEHPAVGGLRLDLPAAVRLPVAGIQVAGIRDLQVGLRALRRVAGGLRGAPRRVVGGRRAVRQEVPHRAVGVVLRPAVTVLLRVVREDRRGRVTPVDRTEVGPVVLGRRQADAPRSLLATR